MFRAQLPVTDVVPLSRPRVAALEDSVLETREATEISAAATALWRRVVGAEAPWAGCSSPLRHPRPLRVRVYGMEPSLEDLVGAPRRQLPDWWRWVGIGGAVVVVILFAVLFIGMLSARRMLTWGVHRITNAVLAALPPELPGARREQARLQLDCALRAAESGKADERRLGEFAKACSQALEDRNVSTDELARIESLAAGLCGEAGSAADQ